MPTPASSDWLVARYRLFDIQGELWQFTLKSKARGKFILAVVASILDSVANVKYGGDMDS
jgi:hypothetical protein